MLQKHHQILEGRVRHAIKRLAEGIYSGARPLEIAAWHVKGEPVPVSVAMEGEYAPFAVGDAWGGLWDTTWFRFQGGIPREWAGREVVALVRLTDFDYEGFTAEGLIYQEGKILRALNANRCDIGIATEAVGGERFLFHVEAAANGGCDRNGFLAGMCAPDYLGKPRYRLAQADLCLFNRPLAAYYYDLLTVSEAMETFPESSPRRAALREALNRSVDQWLKTGCVEAGREALCDVMARRNSATVHTISAVGHGHIDTAWLWPLREAIRKCARTFSTALDYMARYPEYVFACSQPQQYLWMKVHYPAIWEGIREAVRRGQWEVVGSMWIEADCNLPSGESLARQLLYGKRFFLREFGIETKDVWLPDVFGYPGTLPQIFRHAGVAYFMTQKLSWNQYNRFPYHTFHWEGIDGSRLFTHFPPAGNYSADTGAADLCKTARNFTGHAASGRSLLLYGYGDGGGGPSIAMLEKARRLRDFEGLPKLDPEPSAEFFRKAEREAGELPEWFGELYLELHRGTFTSQAATKLGNRRAEAQLRDAEWADVASWLLNPGREERAADPPRAVYDVTGLDEPPERWRGASHRAALERAWKLVLLNQFHDILPGSSIHWVYEDSARDYQTIGLLADSVKKSGADAIAACLPTAEMSEPWLVWNSLGFERRGVTTFPDGRPAWVEVPACGYRVVDAASLPEVPCPPVRASKNRDGHTLENECVRLTWNDKGELVRIFDLRHGRDLLAAGAIGNLLCLYHDDPARHDAWEIEPYYRRTRRVIDERDGEAQLEFDGAGRYGAGLRLAWRFGASRIVQRVKLRAGSPRIDFETEVEWHEEHQFLRVLFPVNVHSGRATYDISYGVIERPTRANTSWDHARFEVCAHQWADLSEPGFGVALLNNGKYGYDARGNTLGLSLLRSSTMPDPVADRGHHAFTYSLLPHGGDFRTARVAQEAAALNQPLCFQRLEPRTGTLPPASSLLQCDTEGIRIEAFKRAEEGDEIVVRLVEGHGARGEAALTPGFAVKEAAWCDLLERMIEPAEIANGSIRFPFRPYEIKTLRLALSRE